MLISSILTCIVIIKLHCVTGVQPEIMYPFGPSSSDISLPKNDVRSYGPIRLNFELKFFDKFQLTIQTHYLFYKQKQ
jgi:hypothetical protein